MAQKYQRISKYQTCGEGTKFIEIKQTKEDMEEKNNGNTLLNVLTDKYVNGDICYDDFEKEVKALYSCKEEIKPTLKPFDLEAAKAGKPVCTRDGYKARIICFDAKGMHQPIVALVTQDNGVEYIETYYSNGRFNDDINSQSSGDLMMLPEKKEGWVNVYHNEKGEYWSEQVLFSTKKEAVDFVHDHAQYVTTVKIDWEE